jgi:hypothetical protein
MASLEELVAVLRRDGFVFLRDFFPVAQVAKAAQELTRWYEVDRQDREANRVHKERYHGAAGTSNLTASTHLLIDAYGRSAVLDEMVERVLTDSLTSALLRRMGGRYLKFRGYNIRRMTGRYDPGPSYPRRSALPHEWHRDSPGEMGIGVFLSDIPEGGNAGTALVPGSHLFPYDPRWNTLFHCRYRAKTLAYSGIPFLARIAPFNRLLARSVLRQRQEGAGRCGDLFFFFNDVWHGRYPNLHGRQSMLMLLGAFPTDFPFPDEVTPPPAEVLAKLPLAVRLAASAQAPVNEERETLMHWMLANRRPLRPFGLFSLARLERRIADRLSLCAHAVRDWWRAGHPVTAPWRWLNPARRAASEDALDDKQGPRKSRAA